MRWWDEVVMGMGMGTGSEVRWREEVGIGLGMGKRKWMERSRGRVAKSQVWYQSAAKIPRLYLLMCTLVS